MHRWCAGDDAPDGGVLFFNDAAFDSTPPLP